MQKGKRSQSFIQFLLRRLIYALVSFFLITMVLYGGVMLIPAEARAQLYWPIVKGERFGSENLTKTIIRDHHLNDPAPIQYAYWLKSLFDGTWGYSPSLHEDVLPALQRRTPVTLELALYSLLVAIPLGLWSGLRAGWQPRRPFDLIFRGCAYVGLSMPPFILAMLLIAVFYAQLRWFPPGRLDDVLAMQLVKGSFQNVTGMITIDALLNARMDVFVNALRHLVMPVFTLALYHWATLGRIARTMIMDESRKDYLMAARGRGITEGSLIRNHALPAILAPSLTGIALSAASIVTGVYVVEVMFNLPGISNVIVGAMSFQPDAPAVLGFSVYTVILVIVLMLVLDILQALVDPRVRAETLQS
ncbi:MAG TPA: ABC transporter permease [Anaerolineales bacterium]